MTALPSTSRRARLLAAALDGELGGVSAGSSAGSAVAALHEGATNLVALAGQLQVLAAEPPTPFVGALRERVMAAAVEREVTMAAEAGAGVSGGRGPRARHGGRPSAGHHRPRRRSRRALATGVVSVLVTSGTAVGLTAVSAQALPGELLYPVKRGVERLELALQRSSEAEGVVLLEHAATRLMELESLLADEDATSAETQDLVDGVLDDFAAATNAASAALEDADGSITGSSGDGLDESTDESLASFLAESARTLDGLAGDLPTDAYVSAAAAVNGLQDEAADLCGDCAPEASGDLVDPSPTGHVSGSPAPPVTSVADGSGAIPLTGSGTDAEDTTSGTQGDPSGGGAGAGSPLDAAPQAPSGPAEQPADPGDAPSVPDEQAAPGTGSEPAVDSEVPTGTEGGTAAGGSGGDQGTTPDSGGDSSTDASTDTGTGTSTGTSGDPAPDAGDGTDSGTGTTTDDGGATGGGTSTDTSGDPAPDAGDGTDTGGTTEPVDSGGAEEPGVVQDGTDAQEPAPTEEPVATAP